VAYDKRSDALQEQPIVDFLIGLLGLVASVAGGAGYFVDHSARQLLLQELDRAEVLEVRIQSTPNYRLLNGEADRLLVAGRGLYRKPFPRVDVLELETDPLQIDPGLLRGEPLELQSPLQAAVRVVITTEDLNAALQAPEILHQFQNIKADLPLGAVPNQQQVFDLNNPRAELLPEGRIQLSAQLTQRAADTTPSSSSETLDIVFSSGLQVENGQRLRLDNPEFTLGSVRVPDEIANAFLGGLNETLSLNDLEDKGITARVLKLAITPASLEVVGFIRIESLATLTDPDTVGLSSLR
jgi:hypothetical protein